jgi:hypothetical protein
MSGSPKLNSKKYFQVSNQLYPTITKLFSEIESGDSTLIQQEKLEDKIKKALSILKQIDISSIKTVVNKETLDIIKDNIDYMYEEITYIEKRLLAYKYYDDLKFGIGRYFRLLTGNPDNYKKWAHHPDELIKKFVGVLLHPDNVEMYENQIRRIISGTMSQKEFNRIFDASKHKMSMLPEYRNKFEPYKDHAPQSKPKIFKV